MNNDPTSPGLPLLSAGVSQSPSVLHAEVGTMPEQPIFKEYDRQRSFDRVRASTTYISVIIFGLTVLLSFVAIYFAASWANTKELLQLVIPAETALIGSAVGFYFGSKSATSDQW